MSAVLNDSSFGTVKVGGVSLDSLVDAPLCPLTNNSDKCDVPFLRSLFPQAQRCTCAKSGKCIVREVEKLDGKYSIVTILFYNQIQKRAVPVDKIRAAIDGYCASHNV
jgi:hypothetical protein